MKKFILPLVIILVLILAILFSLFISSAKNDQNIDNPSGTEVITPEITEEMEEVEEVDIYKEYNIQPGSYEANLLDQYSGDSDFISEDNDGDGFPDGIFKEVPEAPLVF